MKKTFKKRMGGGSPWIPFGGGFKPFKGLKGFEERLPSEFS